MEPDDNAKDVPLHENDHAPDRRYIIGIDLGTTNSAVSYVDLHAKPDKGDRIKIFNVPQLTGAGEFSKLPVLPSFLYIPGTYDISKKAVSIPWKTADDNFVGAFARDHGAKVPARLVSSAKSWLCHSNVDRNARILPWGAGEEVYKVSPVQATAAYLTHIKKAWNRARGDDADQYLENQVVIITVPASFDEVARDLTLEAASLAGISQAVTLLEEPLAAFYAWLIRHEKNWSDYVRPDELILVCDVGGGTTDFTLITLRESEGSPRFERIAVGDHLILGGDNIDLALARRIEMRLSENRKKKSLSLSTDRWKALCHECRQGKETVLDRKAESKRITLMGEGRKLIAETISAKLAKNEIEETVLEGFFPLVKASSKQETGVRKGITEFGLPYEPEPAITKHLGWFLDRHRETVRSFLGRDNHAPDLILFNGGSLKAEVVQEQIRAAIRKWFGLDDETLPRVLENRQLDLSVALGASYYGLVKIGQGVRVGSGSARSFYLGVASGEADAAEKTKAICLVERGLDEGTPIELKDREFEVLANQPVTFDVYSSSYRSGDRCGDILEIDESMTPLPPIQTVVQYGKKGVKTAIPVQIEAEYTEMGTLALWCRSSVSNHRWQLQFQLRDATAASQEVSDREVFEEAVVESAREKVKAAFGDKSDTGPAERLVKEIAGIVERPKEKWPLVFIRALADDLHELMAQAKSAPQFESRWMNLIGFCMRPGFGDGFDEHRVKQLWKIYKQGPMHTKNAQVRSEWWIMWRRVAGGLAPGQQRQFIQDLTPIVMAKKGKKVPPQESLEIWMAAANMEFLLVKDKIKWGGKLLAEIKPKKFKPQQFWAMSRFGARELLYGPADRVVPPNAASEWIETILEKDWKNPRPVVTALGQMARKTGDRTRDLTPSITDRAIEWMSQFDYAGPHIKLIKEITPLAKHEASAIFGESLPSGIVIRE